MEIVCLFFISFKFIYMKKKNVDFVMKLYKN